MRRLSLLIFLLLPAGSIAQSGAVIPQGGAGHAAQASCVILKRMGPADQVTSRMYSFGIRGKQFQYVEGKLPEGFPFHGRLTDHDVRNLQGRGAEVIVIESHYTAEDLNQARADCRGETGTTPNQSEAKSAAPQSSIDDTNVSHSSMVTANAGTTDALATSTGKLLIASTPEEADIELDGNFVGNTPSGIQVAEGDHKITVKKIGYKNWERKLKVSSGSDIHLSAELEKVTVPAQ